MCVQGSVGQTNGAWHEAACLFLPVFAQPLLQWALQCPASACPAQEVTHTAMPFCLLPPLLSSPCLLLSSLFVKVFVEVFSLLTCWRELLLQG